MLWVQATAAQRQELLREPGELRAPVDALVSVPAAAHKDGWLHRDIKPSNILHFDSRWTLADWASSRPRGQTTKVGRTGRFIGTEGFAAPELPCRRLMNRTVPRNPRSAHSTCAVANVAWPHSLARHPAEPIPAFDLPCRHNSWAAACCSWSRVTIFTPVGSWTTRGSSGVSAGSEGGSTRRGDDRSLSSRPPVRDWPTGGSGSRCKESRSLARVIDEQGGVIYFLIDFPNLVRNFGHLACLAAPFTSPLPHSPSLTRHAAARSAPKAALAPAPAWRSR